MVDIEMGAEAVPAPLAPTLLTTDTSVDRNLLVQVFVQAFQVTFQKRVRPSFLVKKLTFHFSKFISVIWQCPSFLNLTLYYYGYGLVFGHE